MTTTKLPLFPPPPLPADELLPRAPLPADELLPQLSDERLPQLSQVHAREEGAERLSFGQDVVDDFLSTLPADAEMASALRQRAEAEVELARLQSLLGDALRQKRAAAAAVAGLDDAAQVSAHAASLALLDGLPSRIGAAEEQRVLAALACIRRVTVLGQAEIQRLEDDLSPLTAQHDRLVKTLKRQEGEPFGPTTPEQAQELRAERSDVARQSAPLLDAIRNARQAIATARGLAEQANIESTDPWNWEASVTEKILRPNAWAPAAKKAGEAARSQAEYEARGGDEARSGLRPRL